MGHISAMQTYLLCTQTKSQAVCHLLEKKNAEISLHKQQPPAFIHVSKDVELRRKVKTEQHWNRLQVFCFYSEEHPLPPHTVHFSITAGSIRNLFFSLNSMFCCMLKSTVHQTILFPPSDSQVVEEVVGKLFFMAKCQNENTNGTLHSQLSAK